MFELDERRSLTEALAPPAGCHFECGIATTYSLDFTALTVALCALVSDRCASEGEPSPAHVLRALFRARARVAVFVQQGGIHCSGVSAPKRLFQLYDTCVRPRMSKGHAFHPKLWLLKYANSMGGESDAIYRLVCTSRNITTASTIECAVVLSGQRRRTQSRFGIDTAEYLTQVTKGSRVAPALGKLLNECRSVHFDPPPRTSSPEFQGQRPGAGQLLDRLPVAGLEDLIFVSPFLGSGFLDGLLNRMSPGQEPTFISTQQELDEIPPATWERIGPTARWFVARGDAPGIDRQLTLHAKLLLYRSRGQEVALIGSANATSAAWGGRRDKSACNWEAMVKLQAPGLTSRFRKEVVEPRDGSPVWVQPYVRGEYTSNEWAEKLEDLRRRFSGLDLRAVYAVRARRLTLKAFGSTAVEFCPAGLRVSVAPLALDADSAAYRPLSDAWGRGVAFHPISPLDLSQFFTVSVQDQVRQDNSEKFTVRAVGEFSSAVLELRETSVLQSAAPGVQIVNLLLERLGFPPHISPSPHGVAPGRRRTKDRRKAGLQRGLLETILRAWATRPHELTVLRQELGAAYISKTDPLVIQLKQLIDEVQAVPGGRA